MNGLFDNKKDEHGNKIIINKRNLKQTNKKSQMYSFI